jgi:hypothetical protein
MRLSMNSAANSPLWIPSSYSSRALKVVISVSQLESPIRFILLSGRIRNLAQ